MKQITQESQLIVGESYWLRGRTHAIASLCRERGTGPYFEEQVWAMDNAIGSAFDRWDIWGPIPKPIEWDSNEDGR